MNEGTNAQLTIDNDVVCMLIIAWFADKHTHVNKAVQFSAYICLTVQAKFVLDAMVLFLTSSYFPLFFLENKRERQK